MRFKTIKILKEGTTVIWESPKEGGGYTEGSVKNGDDPRQAFKNAINDLKDFLIDLSEASGLDKKLIKTTGVQLSYKGEHETMNVIITGYRTYKNSGGSNPLISPGKATGNPTGKSTAEENLLPEKCIKIVEKLITEAKEYIKDPKRQTTLV